MSFTYKYTNNQAVSPPDALTPPSSYTFQNMVDGNPLPDGDKGLIDYEIRVSGIVELSDTMNINQQYHSLKIIGENGSVIRSKREELEKQTNDVYYRYPAGTDSSKTGFFPVIFGNNGRMEVMSLETVCNIIIDDTTDPSGDSFVICLNIINGSLPYLDYGAYSYIFVHWRWLVYRFQLTASPTISDSNDYLFPVKCTDLESHHLKWVGYNNNVTVEFYNPHLGPVSSGKFVFDGTGVRTASNFSGKLYIATLQTLVNIEHVKHVTIENVNFEDNAPADITYMSGNQTENWLEGVIEMKHVENVVVKNCHFTRIWGYAISVNRYPIVIIEEKDAYTQTETLKHYDIKSRYIQIVDCHIHDVFGGGVILNNCTGCHVRNNLIERIGALQGGAVGIALQNANEVNITHNTVCETNYTGISIGIINGYEESSTKSIYIAANKIYDCMQNNSDDGGGIYIQACSEGSIVENNIIYNVRPKNGIEGSAIYLDGACSYVKVRYNICFNCNWLIHHDYGKCNEIYNNLLALIAHDPNHNDIVPSVFRYSMAETKHLSFYAHNNMVVAIGEWKFLDTPSDSVRDEGVYLFRRNLVIEIPQAHPVSVSPQTENDVIQDLNYFSVRSLDELYLLWGFTDPLPTVFPFETGGDFRHYFKARNIRGFHLFKIEDTDFVKFYALLHPDTCGRQVLSNSCS